VHHRARQPHGRGRGRLMADKGTLLVGNLVT